MSQKPSFDQISESNPEKPSLVERTRTTNKAGGEAFEPFTPEFSLYKVVLNQLLEDQYYDTVDESFEKIWDRYDRVADENPEFVLQLAVHARQTEGLRDIPQLLLVLAANDERVTKPDDQDSTLIRDYTPSIIDRTDEFNSVLSYQLRGFGKPIPNGLKRGIEDALHHRYVIVDVGGETFRQTYVEGKRTNENGEDIGRYEAKVCAAGQWKKSNGMAVVTGVEEIAQAGAEIVDEGYIHDSYTCAKYSQRDKECSLHDVINLVRPAPRSDNRDELFGRIVKGELDDHDDIDPLREDRTWESEMSEDDDRTAAEKFRERLDDMGLMARIRNVRNMREAGLTGEEIFDYDDDVIFGENSKAVVRQHKMPPFRLYQAFKACGETGINRSAAYLQDQTKQFDIGRGDLLDEYSEEWLNEAIDVATENLPETLENTFTAIDLSGSMDSPISGNSEMARAEIASLFGAMLMKRESDTGAFGSDFVSISMDESGRRTTSTLHIAQRIYAVGDEVGNSTNGFKAIDWATANNESYDRFVVFTDEQIWDSTTSGLFGGGLDSTLKESWDNYTEQVNPDAHLYVIDLASFGSLSMPEGYENVHQISGWSESVVEFVDNYEQADDVVADIESISPDDY